MLLSDDPVAEQEEQFRCEKADSPILLKSYSYTKGYIKQIWKKQQKVGNCRRTAQSNWNRLLICILEEQDYNPPSEYPVTPTAVEDQDL